MCAGCLHLPNIPSPWHLSSIQFLSKNKPKNNHVSRTWDLSILGTSKTLLDIVRIWYFSFAVVLWGLYLIVDQWLWWLRGNFYVDSETCGVHSGVLAVVYHFVFEVSFLWLYTIYLIWSPLLVSIRIKSTSHMYFLLLQRACPDFKLNLLFLSLCTFFSATHPPTHPKEKSIIEKMKYAYSSSYM